MIENNKEILNDSEREHLAQVVKELRYKEIKVRWIKKAKNLYDPTDHREYCLVYYPDEAQPTDTFFIVWDDFKENARYKGMEEDKLYTLEELGL